MARLAEKNKLIDSRYLNTKKQLKEKEETDSADYLLPFIDNEALKHSKDPFPYDEAKKVFEKAT